MNKLIVFAGIMIWSILITPTLSAATIHINKDLISLCNKVEKYNSMKGHFDGEDWNDILDKWNGDKHKTLINLSSALESKKIHSEILSKHCGLPNKVLQKDNLDNVANVRWIWREPDTKKALDKTKYWLYSWRTNRDFLVLDIRENKVMGAGWLMAGE